MSQNRKEIVMGFQLTGDQLRRGHKKLGEIHRQLGQREYPFDPEKLMVVLDALAEGRFEAVVCGQFPSLTLATDLIPEYMDEQKRKHKWEVVEDVASSTFQTLKDLEFLPFLRGKEISVKGEVMRQRALELMANFGLCDAQRLMNILNTLGKCSDELQGKYIVLAGTVLRGPGGRLHVPYLYRYGWRWCLNFRWIDDDWFDYGRLPRRKSK